MNECSCHAVAIKLGRPEMLLKCAETREQKVSQRQLWKLNSLLKLDTGHGGSYSLSGVRIVGVYRG